MPKPTLQQKIIAALNANDEFRRDDNARSSRYVVFDVINRPPSRLFVGRKGAVRIGRTVTSSMPVRDAAITEWIDKGSEILSKG